LRRLGRYRRTDRSEGRDRKTRCSRNPLGRRRRPNGVDLVGLRARREGEARKMNVAQIAARNARGIVFGAMLITAAGIYSMATLPSGIYPEVEFPRIVVIAHSGDLSPRMMQVAVTRQLEEAARGVLGVRRVRSKTIRGATEISVQFNPDADMQYAL